MTSPKPTRADLLWESIYGKRVDDLAARDDELRERRFQGPNSKAALRGVSLKQGSRGSMTWTRKRWKPPPRPGKLVYREAMRIVRPDVADKLDADMGVGAGQIATASPAQAARYPRIF